MVSVKKKSALIHIPNIPMRALFRKSEIIVIIVKMYTTVFAIKLQNSNNSKRKSQMLELQLDQRMKGKHSIFKFSIHSSF